MIIIIIVIIIIVIIIIIIIIIIVIIIVIIIIIIIVFDNSSYMLATVSNCSPCNSKIDIFFSFRHRLWIISFIFLATQTSESWVLDNYPSSCQQHSFTAAYCIHSDNQASFYNTILKTNVKNFH